MDATLFSRGENCEWCGKLVKDMTREELIEFIGQLDYIIEKMANKETT